MPMQPLVAVEDVHTYYGKSHILHGVSLHVERGEVVGLLGRNGVGKSTTLKTIMGLVYPNRGKVLFAGSPVTGRGAPPLTACSVNPVEYGTAVCPFVSGLNRNPANRNRGCETSAIVESVSGCSIAIILLSGETDATGVAGASSSVSIPCGGF